MTKCSTAVKFVGAHTAALFCVSAYALFDSFGNSPLCSYASCVLWIGGLAGLIGVPVSMLFFWMLSQLFRHPGGSGEAYAGLAYAAVATCYLRWFPPLSIKNGRVDTPGDQ